MIELISLQFLMNFGFIIFVFLVMVIVHEIGHVMVLDHYLKQRIPVKFRKGSIEVGTQEQIDSLNNKHYFLVLFVGLLLGIVVLFLFSDKFTDVGFLGVLFLYLYVSRSDIIEIFKLNKKTDLVFK